MVPIIVPYPLIPAQSCFLIHMDKQIKKGQWTGGVHFGPGGKLQGSDLLTML